MVHAFELERWHVRRADTFHAGPVDLALDAGEIATFIGPSGVGKTTILLSTLGYSDRTLISAGTRRQTGAALEPGQIPERALYIPQQQPFNPNWRVGAFLERLTRAAAPHYASSVRTRVDAALRELDILHRRDATIAELSGGESQRAALAQLLLIDPVIVVGDEFVSALDPAMVRWVLDRCRTHIRRTSGIGFFALHDVSAALAISDYLVVLWPADISHPWVIRRGTAAWESATIHALLVVARSTTDVVVNPDLQELLRMIDVGLREPDALRDYGINEGTRHVRVRAGGAPITLTSRGSADERQQFDSSPSAAQLTAAEYRLDNGSIAIAVTIARRDRPPVTLEAIATRKAH